MQQSQGQVRPFAVITGAAGGFGLDLAKQFAQNGFDLLIASNSESILEVQDELEVHGTDIECIEVNLATFKGVEILTETIKSYKRQIDVLVINGTAGMGGTFLDTDLKEEIHLINKNAVSIVHLTKNLLGDMYDFGSGRILYSFPYTFEIVSNATKAFTASFAESIRHEAKDYGVTVTTFMPGPAHSISPYGHFRDDSPLLAHQAYEAVMAGAENVFETSLKAKIQDWASKVLPERFKASYHRIISDTNQQDHS